MQQIVAPSIRPLTGAQAQLEIHTYARFDAAKRLWATRAFFHVLIAAGAFASLFPIGKTATLSLAGVTIACQLIAWHLSGTITGAKTEAEESFRILLLSYGFGIDPHELGASQLSGFIEATIKKSTYGFFCCEGAGYPSLLRVVQEISFYLAWLNNRCREVMAFLFFGVSLISLVAIVILSQSAVNDEHWLIIGGRLVIAFAALTLAFDLFGMWRSFSTTAVAFKQIDVDADVVLKQGAKTSTLHRATIWMLVLRFFSTFEKAPLLPWKIHQNGRERLRQRWQVRPHHVRPLIPFQR